MRILHIIGTLDPKAGGPVDSVHALMQYAPDGYTGEAVTFDDPASPFLQEISFPVHALGPTSSNYGYDPRVLQWLQENRSRFDGAIVHGLWQYCGLAAMRALRGHIPYVVFTHGMLDPYFKRAFPLKHLKKAVYWYQAEYWVLRRAYRVLFTTQIEEELAAQSFAFHRWSGFLAPLGTSGPPVEEEQALRAFYALCPAAKEKRFLLFLGRIHSKKGVDLLIEAFGKMAQSDPELYLMMAGPDQQGLQASLEQRAKELGVADRILWPGLITGEAKWGSLYACEAFILPSHQENFGIAVAEALSCGRPVLLSDQVNIAPEIASDHAGYVEKDTPEGTLRLLQRWTDTSSAARITMREQALRTFQQRYDMKKNAKTILRLFESARPTQ